MGQEADLLLGTSTFGHVLGRALELDRSAVVVENDLDLRMHDPRLLAGADAMVESRRMSSAYAILDRLQDGRAIFFVDRLQDASGLDLALARACLDTHQYEELARSGELVGLEVECEAPQAGESLSIREAFLAAVELFDPEVELDPRSHNVDCHPVDAAGHVAARRCADS